MKKSYVHALLFIALIAGIAVGGVYAGQHYFHHDHAPHAHVKANGLNEYIHSQLGITPQQDAKLSDIEQRYQEQITYLEEKLKLSNMELANAVREDKRYGARVEKAITDNHTTMGELQKVTMKHLFDMQTVLTAEQNEKMNKVITDALYHQP